MADQPVLVREWKTETTGYIQLNRPEKANAYNRELLGSLEAALGRAEDDEEISVLVITGAGDRSFCAGADLDEMNTKNYLDAINLRSSRVFSAVAALSKVTIAAINGAAVAGGLELALACDIRICSENARFFLPETKRGLIPAAGGTQRLPKVVGLARAKELILGGSEWSAAEGLRFGLVSEMVRFEELPARAAAWGRRIGQRDRLALRLAKLSIDADQPFGSGYHFEKVAEALLYLVKKRNEPAEPRFSTKGGQGDEISE